ncbi:MAG: serine protease [Clostridia bacterium]|nr:serine protease [Clostridia bacterium]
MKKRLGLIITSVLACVLIFAVCFSGCFSMGASGRDGKDLNIYEIYDAVNEERKNKGLEELDFLQFVSEYLNYSQGEIEEATSLQSTMNRSMQSSVAILCRFAFSERAWGGYQTYYSVGGGSGVIIDLDKENGDALVVTNCHVIYAYGSNDTYCKDIRLYLYGQDVNGVNYAITQTGDILYDENYRIPATIVGASITYDIAVLKVEGSEVLKRSDVTAATFSQEEHVTVGEPIYAVGNASVEGVATTQGIISRDSEEIYLNLKDTDLESDYVAYRVLRTDTAINGGNSGGGLFNAKGELVGIVNAKTIDDEIDNMGYALPASTVKRVVQSLIDNSSQMGKNGVKKAQLGITTQIVDSYAEYVDEKGAMQVYETVQILSVETGIAKAQGGLKAGDVIVNVAVGSGKDSSFKAKDEVKVLRDYNITDILLSVRVGDVVKVTVERDGENKDIYYEYSSNNYFITQI